ncbi:elongation of very long chain fatty acids protein 4 [Lingula anatina]|uniref:Elongation of very long chain fatty acids protein n=1 Tax=Lingula anatina TaxID=7574 RepID=A0A1S3KHV4_LINAN|nr:elongation of very long chain fatty acids protein 4 [Lingula anatina]|eukprot:XP_013422210.1 elongation of very long chain fatty acids protein 4 [Lingula anatina]
MASEADVGLGNESSNGAGSVQLKGYMNFINKVLHLPSMPIFCVYIILVVFRSKWQQNTKPLTLRPVLVVYNLVCCLLSSVTLLGFMYGLLHSPHIYDKSPSHLLAPFYFTYWITKTIELLDTVFMILRHKQRQISFLHVYHHSSMLLLSDFACRYVPWPAIAPILAINSFVHVVLYFYYGMTAWHPNISLEWKKNLTQLQILQFFIDFVFAGVGYVYHGFCIYGFLYGLGMTSLFMNFYHKAYIHKRPAKSE